MKEKIYFMYYIYIANQSSSFSRSNSVTSTQSETGSIRSGLIDINVNSYRSSYSEVVTKYSKDDKFLQFKYPEKLEDVPGIILSLARLMEQLYQEVGEKFDKKKGEKEKKKSCGRKKKKK
jgi:hypothetical protein